MTNCGYCGEEQSGVGLLCRRCGAPVATESSTPTEAIPNQPPFAPWGTPPTTPPPGDAAGDVVFQPRKPRWPVIVALIAALVIAGAVVFVSTRGSGSSSKVKAAAASRPEPVKVHFGSEPQVDPVNRLFSSMAQPKFDRAMFLSAFDMAHDSCGLASRATQGEVTGDSSVPDGTATVKSTGSNTANVDIKIAGADAPLTFAVHNAGGYWTIDKMILPASAGPAPAGFTGSPCDIYTIFLGASIRAKDRDAQSDLRNALTAEKTYYVDNEAYSADIATLKSIEPSLAWGTKLKVTTSPGSDNGILGVGNGAEIVCLSETGKSGKTYALGDVAYGDNAGTYYGTKACPANPTAAEMAAMGSTPWGESSSGDSSAPPGDPQSDLRNALTAEKTAYTDAQMYTADAKTLKEIESSLDWGGKLQVVVGTAVIPDDMVCLSEGTYSIADVAAGDQAGTYYSHTSCPAKLTPGAFSSWQSSW